MDLNQASLPYLDHLTLDDESKVYIPAEDTFLLCDALSLDRSTFLNLQPKVVIEIGSGSGCVITYIHQLFDQIGISASYFATDINPDAVALTRRTAEYNGVEVECVQTSFCDALVDKLASRVDVLIFNPPYVPTDSEEVQGNGIEAAWAGGIDGREVIDKFIGKIDVSNL